MKWASSLALVLLVVCVTYAKPPLVERVCTPNDSWKEDCNDCICSEDNKPMCTRRDCTPSTTARPHECRRGETWAQGCNTCRCGSTGIAMCTMKACLEVPTLAPFPESCRPGATWMKDCNTCRCVGGRSICTMMACLGSGASSPSGSTPLPLPIPVGDDCTPGDTWKEKCNSCRCTPNGLAVCTLMKCLT